MVKTDFIPIDYGYFDFNGRNYIKITGRDSRGKRVCVIDSCSVFVLPSKRWEGFPMVLAEAMASGLPIIASEVGGIPSVIQNEENGLLIEPGSISDLSTSLLRLYLNPNLQKRLGDKAEADAKQKYSQESRIKGYSDLMDKIQ